MTVDDSVMQKLWKLTNELTAQLVFNRNATLELKQQLADLQAKTAQGSVSVAQDVTVFSNQEHADVSLRIANERLMEENAQLQEQVREYERWMEFIMTKFRLQNFAMAQSRKEAMQEAYKMAEQEGELAQQLQEENAVLQARLVDVGAVARKAINEEYYNTESAIETLELENQGLREMLGIATEHRNPIAISRRAAAIRNGARDADGWRPFHLLTNQLQPWEHQNGQHRLQHRRSSHTWLHSIPPAPTLRPIQRWHHRC
ncbi:hypothetical protein K457DRAFT_593527 [Linnemannia elongata AG-77]|uniref:Uncharacterized protein n=1 Tax=Linnemannia elongata AG-77 TaxID=1314771 RepID=A0A197JSZ8_9FUNG|nr:hypothetical protein K457DRAFT_593527 [Linnemannia elongata AG-77]